MKKLGVFTVKTVPMVLMCAAVLAVAACGPSRKDRVYFNGLYFPAKSKSVDKKNQRERFVVTLKGVTQSLTLAGEAAHYEGTRYCIENYGSSVIIWDQDPLTTTVDRVPAKDQMDFKGVCKP